jgi:hypothetical protein
MTPANRPCKRGHRGIDHNGFGIGQMLLLFDFNGNFAKIPPIQKQDGPSAHFLFVRTL